LLFVPGEEHSMKLNPVKPENDDNCTQHKTSLSDDNWPASSFSDLVNIGKDSFEILLGDERSSLSEWLLEMWLNDVQALHVRRLWRYDFKETLKHKQRNLTLETRYQSICGNAGFQNYWAKLTEKYLWLYYAKRQIKIISNFSTLANFFLFHAAYSWAFSIICMLY